MTDKIKSFQEWSHDRSWHGSYEDYVKHTTAVIESLKDQRMKRLMHEVLDEREKGGK